MNRYYPLVILTAIVASPFCFIQQVSAQRDLRPEFYSQARLSVVLIENTVGARRGTGFIVNGENGTYYVLTAGHVAPNGGEQLQIRTDTNETRRVDIVLPLPGIDLALLQFRSSNPQTIAALANDATAVRPTTRVFILGYPAAGSGSLEIPGGTVTSRQPSPSGVTSAIFHTADTIGGMSGSPVLNENGEVVGIHIGLPSPTGFREAIPIELYRQLAPRVFTQAGRDNLRDGNFDPALASLEQVRGLIGSNNTDAALIRAYAYFGKGELDKARNEVRQLGNSNATAALLLGTIDYLQGNFSNSINNLNRANELDNINLGSYALAIRGLSHAGNSSFGEANDNASRAIDSAPGDSFVYFARSCIRAKARDLEAARTDLVNANSPERQASPPNVYLAVLKSRLQGLLRNCVPEGLPPGPVPDPVPRGGRYKSSNPVSLGEESTGLAVSRDSRLVATGLRNGTVSVYDVQTKGRVASFNSGQGRDDISSITFSPNGKDIAIAATNGAVKVFDIQTQQEKYNIADAGSRPLVVFSNNGNFLFIGSGSGTLRMVDNRSGRIRLAEANTHTTGIASLALSPDGRLLATGGGDGVVKLWSTSDLTPVDGGYQAHRDAVISLAFSPDSSQMISIGDKVVKSCNWQNKSCTDIANSQDSLNSLAVASNGHIAFSEVSFLIQQENPIFLRDLRNGQSLGTLLGHRDRIVALAYTPDSRYLISGSSDGTIIIWEVQ